MILDERMEFADAAVAFGALGHALIGDVIDLQELGRDPGNGEPLFFVVTVDTEIITAGVAGTLRFKLVSDAAAAIAVDGTATEHYVSHDFITDDAAANAPELNAGGVPVAVALPIEGVPYERFLGVLVETVTTATTAGNISAFLTHDVARWKAKPNALGA